MNFKKLLLIISILILSACNQFDQNNKKLVYLSTSPGEYGAASVLAAAVGSVSYFGGELIGSLSVPNFQENFSVKKEEIINPNLNDKLEDHHQFQNKEYY